MNKEELVEEILDIIDHSGEMTRSDLQATVEALANKALKNSP